MKYKVIKKKKVNFIFPNIWTVYFSFLFLLLWHPSRPVFSHLCFVVDHAETVRRHPQHGAYCLLPSLCAVKKKKTRDTFQLTYKHPWPIHNKVALKPNGRRETRSVLGCPLLVRTAMTTVRECVSVSFDRHSQQMIPLFGSLTENKLLTPLAHKQLSAPPWSQPLSHMHLCV